MDDTTTGDRAQKNAEQIYDQKCEDYENAFDGDEGLLSAIEDALSLLKPRGRILDIGCGTGKPVAQLLASRGHDVTGIDVSSKMIETASKQCRGTFTKTDMLSYKPSAKFDAIFAILSIFHMSYQDIRTMLSKIYSWLNDDGVFLLSTLACEDLHNESVYTQPGYNEREGIADMVEVEVFRRPTRCSYLSKPRWVQCIKDAGLEIKLEKTCSFDINGPGAWEEKHYYVISRRPVSS